MPHPAPTAYRLLGYPDDARLLLVNADDFGMYAGINDAVAQGFAEGIVRSASLMMPCPGAAEAVRLLAEARTAAVQVAARRAAQQH